MSSIKYVVWHLKKNDKMKILYISNSLTHYYNLVLSKLNEEDNIQVICTAPLGNNSNQVGAGVNLTSEGVNFKVYFLKEKKRFFLYYSYEKLYNVIKFESPDIIVVLLTSIPSFFLELKLIWIIRKLNIPIILKDHPFRLDYYENTLNKINSELIYFNSLSRYLNALISFARLGKILKILHLKIIKKSFQIATAHVNYVEAHDILGSYGVNKEKIFVTRNSPDTDLLFKFKRELVKIYDGKKSSTFRFIHVGRLVAWKRVDLLIKSFARVNRLFPETELIIVGDGPEKKILIDLVDQLCLSNSIIFLDSIYGKDLGKWLIQSDLYVLAGMGGLSINEAMVYGLPVLCSVCDGTEKFLVREQINGRYFIEGDELDLAEKMIWFLLNPLKCKEMGAASERIILKNINIKTVIKEYLRAFDYAIKEK